ncbi:MAG TPA: sucrase ferredoxin [Segeticoccus sp.]|uniref:sucrase ferredoxin n=1 Tax=Segeticoccus sp. TaxID=2706531 RepID=UPI002D7FBEBB|nr:sucrase ferredoxin [Segeticoccus sp.]HET8600272.1 sucrase ferredoxin [Segeticoccus sp.]
MTGDGAAGGVWADPHVWTDEHPESAHGHSRPGACSVQWDAAAASAFGTASTARFWMALDQPGPWGRDAARQSHLDPRVGDALATRCADEGGRFILVRRPGGHADQHQAGGPADQHHAGGHRVFLGWAESDPWLLTGQVADPAALLDRVDWPALAAGDHERVVEGWPELSPAPPVLLVCTNAKRDVCCAVRGRPVALAAAAERPGRVWECSHTGGHRYAPTGVLLPHGQTLARLDRARAVQVVDRAAEGELPQGAVGSAYDRGRSALAPPGQAAESHVRALLGETSLTALSTTLKPAGEDTWRAEVAHRDGRRWQVDIHRETGPEELPASCGKAAGPVVRWQLSLR